MQPPLRRLRTIGRSYRCAGPPDDPPPPGQPAIDRKTQRRARRTPAIGHCWDNAASRARSIRQRQTSSAHRSCRAVPREPPDRTSLARRRRQTDRTPPHRRATPQTPRALPDNFASDTVLIYPNVPGTCYRNPREPLPHTGRYRRGRRYLNEAGVPDELTGRDPTDGFLAAAYAHHRTPAMVVGEPSLGTRWYAWVSTCRPRWRGHQDPAGRKINRRAEIQRRRPFCSTKLNVYSCIHCNASLTLSPRRPARRRSGSCCSGFCNCAR